MASEYLKWKARNVSPDEPAPPMTRREKIKNWLYYNKLWLIVGAVVLWVIGTAVFGVLGIGKTKPDYVFAYVGRTEISADDVSLFEKALASLGTDVNGDGKVTVKINLYPTASGGDAETVMQYNYSSDVKLLADITADDSYFFLTDDPRGLQGAWQILADADGNPPDDDDYSWENKVFLFNNCPSLSSLDFDWDGLEMLYIGRRCYYGSASEKHRSDDMLWRIITKEAVR